MEESERVLRDGRYICSRILGEGAMGRTYLATDQSSGAEVAVKALYPSRLATIKDLELFEREAAILKRLDHPQIPAYIDAFHEGQGESVCYFLVQTYVEGETLRAMLDRGHRFDEASLLAFARKLLEPLEYIHNCTPQVIHRDIKPANIIVQDNVPTLVDFGAVREVVRLTMGGGSTIIGTFGYMPPEQLMGRALAATDLYAVGITLLECLTRRRPTDLHGEDARRMIEALNTSDNLKRFLQRLSTPALKDRYESCAQALADLERLTQGQALVHAQSIEQTIAVREKEEARELARATGANISIGFVGLALLAIVMGALALFLMIQALANTFDSLMFAVGVISLFGAAIPFVQMVQRYAHDAWAAPGPQWLKSRGVFRCVTERRELDPHGREYSWWYLEFDFRTASGTFKAEFQVPASPEGDHMIEGLSFDVYYPAGKPEQFEAQDFTLPGFDANTFCPFDNTVKHTPA